MRRFWGTGLIVGVGLATRAEQALLSFWASYSSSGRRLSQTLGAPCIKGGETLACRVGTLARARVMFWVHLCTM